MNPKIKSLKQLEAFLNRARRHRPPEKIVFTNGCFDVLHFGHVDYLRKAKKCGDCLVVGLNSDHSVRVIKGEGRPVNRERDRAEVLSELSCVDAVTFFGDETPFRLIKRVRPDVLVKGADWSKGKIVGADFVESYGGKVKRIPLVKGRSTTRTLEKLKGL